MVVRIALFSTLLLMVWGCGSKPKGARVTEVGPAIEARARADKELIPDSMSAYDRSFIGTYRPAKAASGPRPTANDLIMKEAFLKLHGNGTFEFLLSMKYFGTWSSKPGKVVLTIVSAGLDMPNVRDTASGSQPIVFTVTDGGEKLVMVGSPVTLVREPK